MAVATTQIFLGDTLIPFYYVGEDQVGLDPKTATTSLVRNDPFSASLNIAIPFSVFPSLGITSFTQSIDGLIRENNINNSFRIVPSGSNFGSVQAILRTTSSVAISGSDANYNWINEGYDTSTFISGSQNVTGASTASLQFGSSSFVVEMWVKNPPATFSAPPFNMFFFGTPAGSSLLFDYTGASSKQFRYVMTANGAQGVSGNSPSNAFSSSFWHHLAFVRSNTTGSIYFDGNRIASSSSPGFTGSIVTPENNYWRVLGSDAGNINDGAEKMVQDFRVYIGTDKNYTGSAITPPLSMIEVV